MFQMNFFYSDTITICHQYKSAFGKQCDRWWNSSVCFNAKTFPKYETQFRSGTFGTQSCARECIGNSMCKTFSINVATNQCMLGVNSPIMTKFHATSTVWDMI